LQSSYQNLFVDSLTAAARLCFTWAEQQPEAVTDRGRKDLPREQVVRVAAQMKDQLKTGRQREASPPI
jgi:hypothetical protein